MSSKKSNNTLLIFCLLIIVVLIVLVCIEDTDKSTNTENNNTNITTNNKNLYEDYIINQNITISGDLNIFYFYVGQADCTLITSNGMSMLIDAGNDSDGHYISEFLKALNITKLDYVVGTHLEEDHIGGMDELIKRINIDYLYMPYYNNTDIKEYNEIVNSLNYSKNPNLTISELNEGNELLLGNSKIKVLSAEKMSSTSEVNDTSIVLQLDYYDTKYLFMGDATKNIEEKLDLEDVNVLKVGHHGSKTSSSKDFLATIMPEYAIISVDSDSKYKDLPNDEVLTNLKDIKTKIYRTDNNGTIWLKSNGKEIVPEILDLDLNGANRKVTYIQNSMLQGVPFSYLLVLKTHKMYSKIL